MDPDYYPGAPAPSALGAPMALGNMRVAPRGKLLVKDDANDYIQLANLWWRAGAWVIDIVVITAPNWLGDFANPTTGYLLGAIAWIANLVVLTGLTGQSVGKRILGLQVARPYMTADGRRYLAYPGIVVCLIRQIAHILDFLPFPGKIMVGCVRPLWQRRYRTLADSVVNTVVLAERHPPIELERITPGSKSTRNF